MDTEPRKKLEDKPVCENQAAEWLAKYIRPDIKPEEFGAFKSYCILACAAADERQRNEARAKLGDYFLKDKGIYFATQVNMLNGIREIRCATEDEPFWYTVMQIPASTRAYVRDGRLAFVSVN